MTESISNISQTAVGSQSVTQGTKSLGKDEFLKLLTYQLRAQNPLRPYDNQEFASQLAQFSQLEQLTSIRSLLEEQVQTNLLLTQTISNTALPGLIGKYARAMTNEVNFDGEKSVTLGYDLSNAALSGKIIIKDESGRIVREINLEGKDLKNGEHKIQWDGKDNEGNLLEAGKYTFTATMKNGGTSFNADTFTIGQIQAVRFKTEGTMLVINGMEVPLQNVSDISGSN